VLKLHVLLELAWVGGFFEKQKVNSSTMLLEFKPHHQNLSAQRS
jgi:hypothetical protein